MHPTMTLVLLGIITSTKTDSTLWSNFMYNTAPPALDSVGVSSIA